MFGPGSGNYGAVDSLSQNDPKQAAGLGEQQIFNVRGSEGAQLELKVGCIQMSLQELHAAGAEQGSTVTAQLPSDAKLITQAKGLLRMNS